MQGRFWIRWVTCCLLGTRNLRGLVSRGPVGCSTTDIASTCHCPFPFSLNPMLLTWDSRSKKIRRAVCVVMITNRIIKITRGANNKVYLTTVAFRGTSDNAHPFTSPLTARLNSLTASSNSLFNPVISKIFNHTRNFCNERDAR